MQTLQNLWFGLVKGFSCAQEATEVAKTVLHVNRRHHFAVPLSHTTRAVVATGQTLFCKIRKSQPKSVELALSIRSKPLDTLEYILTFVPKSWLPAWFTLNDRNGTIAEFALPQHRIGVKLSAEKQFRLASEKAVEQAQ